MQQSITRSFLFAGKSIPFNNLATEAAEVPFEARCGLIFLFLGIYYYYHYCLTIPIFINKS